MKKRDVKIHLVLPKFQFFFVMIVLCFSLIFSCTLFQVRKVCYIIGGCSKGHAAESQGQSNEDSFHSFEE